MHSLLPNLSTTLITLLATLSLATAAPAQVPPVGPGPVIIAEYITYSDTACTHVIAHENIAPQTQCKGLPEANSLEATFDDDEGTGFALYYDSECQDFAKFIDLNTCVNTEEYLSVQVVCVGGILCAAP